MASTEPTMRAWEQSWAAGDAESLLAAYDACGAVVPPGSAPVAHDAIAEFFRGGFGSIQVRFTPELEFVDHDLAFASGIVRDHAVDTDEVLETCEYAVVWRRADDGWVILHHAWSNPR